MKNEHIRTRIYNCNKRYIGLLLRFEAHANSWLTAFILFSVGHHICAPTVGHDLARLTLKTSCIMLSSLFLFKYIYSLTKILPNLFILFKKFCALFCGRFFDLFCANAYVHSVPLKTCFLIGIIWARRLLAQKGLEYAYCVVAADDVVSFVLIEFIDD